MEAAGGESVYYPEGWSEDRAGFKRLRAVTARKHEVQTETQLI